MRSKQSSNPSSICVYEHDTLALPEISDAVYNLLCYFHDYVNDKYYTIGYKKVKFCQFVGIFSVEQTTIEVLPKVNKDRSTSPKDEVISKKILLQMLELNRYISAQTRLLAFQSLEKNSLRYVLFYQFLSSLEDLITQGLCKKYRTVEANVNSLKGRVLFAKDIQKNSLRPDQWWTNHTVYTLDHQLNGILKAALLVLHDECPFDLYQKLKTIESYFFEISPYIPDENYFAQLKFNRQTFRYETPVMIAWHILQNTGPSLNLGKHNLFTIMFDMNRLFENVVFKLLKKVAEEKNPEIRVIYKEKRKFYNGAGIFPDIVIRKGETTYILDTKWKVIDNEPTIHDVRQMFTYNLYFNSQKAILLYPSTIDSPESEIKWYDYYAPDAIPNYRHQFGIAKIKLVDDHEMLTGKHLRAILDELFD